MNKFKTESEIFTTLSSILKEALRVDPQTITMDSNIFLDLGAESIDILDIRFRIERAFKLKVSQDEFIQGLGNGLDASQMQEKITVGNLLLFILGRLQQIN